ncbi:hypothetical protein BDV93DRAFT_529469 [Ceratobasidium sp. AG-I]|nr:hypothetical protein BDV93DRAFT_529469 [Ceratobasidium sp. AG-I]
MHSTKPALNSRAQRRTLVTPITDIVMSCRLTPKFHQPDSDLRLSADTDLLTSEKEFWLDHSANHYVFQLIDHWRRRRPGLRGRLARQVR